VIILIYITYCLLINCAMRLTLSLLIRIFDERPYRTLKQKSAVNNTLEPSGYFMYRWAEHSVLSSYCICVFLTIPAIHSHYFSLCNIYLSLMEKQLCSLRGRNLSLYITFDLGHVGTAVAQWLCYKSEGHWFDPS